MSSFAFDSPEILYPLFISVVPSLPQATKFTLHLNNRAGLLRIMASNKLGRTFLVISLFILTDACLFLVLHVENVEGGRNVFLPEPLSQSSAAIIDGIIYVIGGRNTTDVHDKIKVMDPLTDTITELNTTLPGPLSNPAAFSDGERIYIVGGSQGIPGEGEICYEEKNANLTIFTPPDVIEIIPDFFPYGIEGNAVASDGTYFYLFGNCMCAQQDVRRNVMRFDPHDIKLDIYEKVLPVNLSGSSAVWYEGAAYIFGGKTDNGKYLDTIIKYIPEGSVEVLDIHLPEAVYKISAAQYGNQVYILGGITETGLSNQFLVVDLNEGTVKKTGFLLCQPRATRASVAFGENIYLLGGDTADGVSLSIEVIRLSDSGLESSVEKENTGNIILVSGIVGSMALIIVISAIYTRDFRKFNKDKEEKGKIF